MQSPHDNKTRSFVAYGGTITTDFALGPYLCVGEGSRFALTFEARAEKGPARRPDQRTSLGSSHGRELTILTDRAFAESTTGQPWCFEVGEVARFYWRGGGGSIEFERLARGTDPLLAFWFIHIFLPLYLTLEGRFEFLHACAVEVGGRTILFTAPSHGGKSTLTDFFLGMGHTLVSDDKVGTYQEADDYFAVPSHPNHRPHREFETLGHRVERFSANPRIIAAIYALRATAPEAAVRIAEVRGHAKMAQLLPGYLFNFEFLQRRRLAYLADMLSVVPVCSVDVPWAMGRISEVYEAIHARQLAAGG